MTSETSQLGPALPVRRRETLEIFDTAFKLYRRYFWVLIGWAAPVAVLSVIPFISVFWFFLMPLIYGAVSCCIAAAVRGQSLSFGQAWSFTKPRFGAMLGTLILCGIMLMVVYLVFYFAGLMLFFLGMLVLSNVPSEISIIIAIIGLVLLTIGFSVLGVAMYGWANMVPIVACLEDDKRGTAAIGRAFDLLKGNWRRLFGISLIMGLAALAVAGIAGGALALLSAVSFSDLLSDNLSDSSFTALLLTFGGFMAVFGLIWNPAQSMVIGVLYLDLRVRREALDLEWTAYASNAANPGTPGAVAPSAPAQPLQDGITREGTGWAPQQSEISPASFAAGHVAGATGEVASGAVEPTPHGLSPLDLSPATEPSSSFTPILVPPAAEPSTFAPPVTQPPVEETVVGETSFTPTVETQMVETPTVESPPPVLESANAEPQAVESFNFEPTPTQSFTFEQTPIGTYTFEPTIIEPIVAEPPVAETPNPETQPAPDNRPIADNGPEGGRA